MLKKSNKPKKHLLTTQIFVTLSLLINKEPYFEHILYSGDLLDAERGKKTYMHARTFNLSEEIKHQEIMVLKKRC